MNLATWAAAMLDRGLTLEQLADLTDYQIQQIICHPRDKQGQLVVRHAPVDTSRPMSLDEADDALREIAAAFGLAGKAEEVIRAKRAKQEETAHGTDRRTDEAAQPDPNGPGGS